MSPYIVIPAFNEAQTIGNIVEECLIYVSNIIVVDDNSSDNTALNAQNAGAKVLKLKFNKGYDNAIEEGMRLAASLGASSILTLDADGQHPTQLIPIFFNSVRRPDVDLVLGIRESLPRISERIFALYTKLFFGVGDITCGMKCYSIELYKKYGFKSSLKSIGTYLAIKGLKNNFKIKSIAVPFKFRVDKSRYGSDIFSEIKIIRALLQSFFY